MFGVSVVTLKKLINKPLPPPPTQPQQPGLYWVGASVPAGRLATRDLSELARIAEKYGDGTVRSLWWFFICDVRVSGGISFALLE
jgi:hypothetical protein